MLRSQAPLTPEQGENVDTLQRLADDAAVVIGRVQEESGVIHVVAEQLEDLTYLLAELAEHGAEIDGLARCDEVRRPIEEQREARNTGNRRNRLVSLMREMPELAGDMDVSARGSAHAPTRKAL